MPQRTPTQVEADKLDCDLFRLIRRAESAAVDAGERRSVERAKWNAAAHEMRSARFHIRELMHKDDIKQTA